MADIINRLSDISECFNAYNNASTISESIELEKLFKDKVKDLKDDISIPLDEIPHYVPISTPKDMVDSGIEDEMDSNESEWMDNYRRTCMMNTADSMNYIKDLREAYSKYECNPCDDTEKGLLKLGWIPGIELNEEAFTVARNNLHTHIENTIPKIIDISETVSNLDASLLESYNFKTKNGLRPVFLVCTYTYSTMGKIITSVTSSRYSHASFGFEPELDKLYSYNMNAKKEGGLSFESINGYIKDNSAAKLYVQCIFVSEKEYNKIKGNVEWYIANWNNSRYSVRNLFNILAGKVKADRYSLSLVCSQFVDSMLKLVHLDLTNKPSNLVTPSDITQIKNPTVYKLFEGLAKDYDANKVKVMLKKLSNNAEEARSTVYENANIDGVSLELCRITDNILSAKSVFYEVTLPIQFNDNGDLSVDMYKSYEDQYQEVHSLLKSEISNADTLDCLARLWYINCTLEKKLNKAKVKKKTGKAEYNKFVKLRSRVLNDFNTQMKKINKSDPEFNFIEYYKNSDYYDGTVKVKRSTLTHAGRYIKNITKMI